MMITLVRLRPLVLAGLFALTGCGGARVVAVPVEAGSAHVAVGEILRVELGPANPSIGDAWYLVGLPDATVLGDGEEFFDPECDEPGCGGRAGWTFPRRARARRRSCSVTATGRLSTTARPSPIADRWIPCSSP